MKSTQTLSRLVVVIGLLSMMLPSLAYPTQLQKATFSSGSGASSNGMTQIQLTTGQSIIGKTGPDAANTDFYLGFWGMVTQSLTLSAVGDDFPDASTRLFKNYPNPFNPSTRISFNLEQEARVRISLYDLKGRKVDTLLEEVKPAGPHSFTYNPKNLASGVYLMLMRAGSYSASQRIMLVK